MKPALPALIAAALVSAAPAFAQDGHAAHPAGHGQHGHASQPGAAAPAAAHAHGHAHAAFESGRFHVRVDGPDQSAAMLREALAGADGQAREIVTLNAGAALYTAGRAVSIADGVAQARAAIASGAATAKLEQFVAATRRLADT